MEGDIYSEEHAGIVPRSVKCILEQLENSGAEFTIRVSFLELYNEELQDLLNTTKDKKLKLCEDVNKGVVCQNLEEITVLSANDIFEILQRGIQNRQTAATLCNKNSSRSHSIFTMKIMVKECSVDGEEVVRHGQLNLVDLAGSECVGRSGAKNDRAREAGNINQSLLTLGRVITALVDHHSHVPYRDSKLTRILQESLGGKAKTCIIATLSPSQLAVEESTSTLEYAYRARSIKNQPTVNQKMTKKVVLKEYCTEIEYLRSQLTLTREKNGVYVDPEQFYGMEARIASQEAQLSECESALKQRSDELKGIRIERDELIGKIAMEEAKVLQQEQQIEEINHRLMATEQELEKTRIEWQATEAVVEEQKRTEEQLIQRNHDLQDEIVEGREELRAMFLKVQRMQDAEMQQLQNFQRLVSGLDSRRSLVLESLKSFHHRSSQDSQLLSQGIQEILEKSQHTCGNLDKSIDHAVQQLLTEAEEGRDSMVSSCSTVHRNLQSSIDDFTSTLHGLRTDLYQWLDEVNQKVEKLTVYVDAQKQEMEKMYDSMENYQQTSEKSIDTWFQIQLNNNRDLQGHWKSLETSMMSIVAQYHQSTHSEMENAQKWLNAQCQRLQESFEQQLKDFSQQAQQPWQRLMSQSNQHKQEIESLVSHCNKEQEESWRRMENEEWPSWRSSRREMEGEYKDYMMDRLHQMGQHVAGVTEHVSSMAEETPHQKTMVNNVMRQLSDRTQQTLQASLGKIDEASQRAEKLHGIITESTQTMAKSTSLAIKDFTGYLENQGQELQDVSHHHFEKSAQWMQEHEGSIQDFQRIAQDFESSIDSMKSEVSGTTPKKRNYPSFPNLPRTRNHEMIKQEKRGFSLDSTSFSSHFSKLNRLSGLSDLSGSCQSSPRSSVEDSEVSLEQLLEDYEDNSSCVSSSSSKKRKMRPDSKLTGKGVDQGGLSMGENNHPNSSQGPTSKLPRTVSSRSMPINTKK